MPDHIDDVVQVEFIPGWRMADGTHMAGLSFTLARGWKTYWRSPGDGGLPTKISHAGSHNVENLAILWPRPQVFRTGGLRSIGYRDRLVLPLHITPTEPADMMINLAVQFGVCEDVCIPVRMYFSRDLKAKEGEVHQGILAAISDRPAYGESPVRCSFKQNDKGVVISTNIQIDPLEGQGEALVVETPNSEIWVSEPVTRRDSGWLRSQTQLVARSAHTAALDPEKLRFTLISSVEAVEFKGCVSN